MGKMKFVSLYLLSILTTVTVTCAFQGLNGGGNKSIKLLSAKSCEGRFGLLQSRTRRSSLNSRGASERFPLQVVSSGIESSTSEPSALASSKDGASSSSHGISKWKLGLVKVMMMAFISSMCVALPLTLFPIYLLRKLKLVSQAQSEHQALLTGQFCARWLLRLFPFCNIAVTPYTEDSPEPSVWVCNHVSMLDIFIILAADKKMRGKNRRPMKSLYWRGIESNPICKLLFRMCGFIPVDMADNGSGNANEYDKSSFKAMLKAIKQAFQDGFDISLLPEGQLNPTPEQGLKPIFPGAFTLAKMSRRPIRMVALHGTHRLWHADEAIGMTVTGRDVKVRVYPPMGRNFKNAEEFTKSFEAIVGTFGTTGKDLPPEQISQYLCLDGS